MRCAACQERRCYNHGKVCVDYADKVMPHYEDPEQRKILSTAGRLESEYYMKLTRLEELMRFAREMGYSRLGMAFCVGLGDEAAILNKALEKEGFQVSSVCCKVCGIDKRKFNIPNIIEDRYEATCNPVGQAMILNDSKTELNIIVGLCIGHDILFTKYSKAPVTTLVVKDRVLAHNPLGVIYTGYYRVKKLGLK
ncbi:DUF1847 domain-containing protein [Calderihabitans maritimus]|uniref:Metal-binding protein n=1 Tax=Calderihabitans maritimus TaxID=1246530 RepID=A0A1Z5HTZ8_9FIRM|nr:DUF1847 domain-containing protein [Calderihabitans maritimus]GAW92817.1 metal-binding protein [Calderihabitans maritimus]